MNIDTKRLSKLIKEAEKIKSNVDKERDRLREIADDIISLADSMEEFGEEFRRAMDTLSQYV